jgi:hypothetical protein
MVDDGDDEIDGPGRDAVKVDVARRGWCGRRVREEVAWLLSLKRHFS